MALDQPASVRLFQVDAFTNRLFAGNPAAVMVLDTVPDDAVLSAIAQENNLSETAFITGGQGQYAIRWFTPTVEVPLCGHATLASAAVVLERLEPERDEVTFASASGLLVVRRAGTSYVMDFPARFARQVNEVPEPLAEALGVPLVEVAYDGSNYIARLADEDAVRSVAPRLDLVLELPADGVIVTAEGANGADIVSRYFAPAKGIPEDPVTGAAHCSLAPFWAERLGTNELRARQLSSRGGELHCSLIGERVELTGSAVFFFEGWAPSLVEQSA